MEKNRWQGGVKGGILRRNRMILIIVKIFLALFLIAWTGVGIWMVVKYDRIFGYHPDDPSESSGARALNVTQVGSVWFGFFATAFYFLIC